jgi:hypothetical protein
VTERLTGLEGNGIALVRERALAAKVQHSLERLYRLDRVVDIDGFVAEAEDGERETLLVREDDGDLEIELRIRPFGLEGDSPLDSLCQLIEGVSHFVYLTHRAASDRTTTELELELQAEVDKYVLLVGGPAGETPLRERLYERVSFLHEPDSERGQRYRVANDAAQRYTARLEREFVRRNRFGEMRAELRRFFRMGQAEKLRLARI